MTTVLVLWTFVFHAPSPVAGRSVHNLTERACQMLRFDTERVFKQPVGTCHPQTQEMP
jgi:hypothetical protein